MLREAFYYLLGGVTFLPLCTLGLVLYFYLYVPLVDQPGPPAIAADVELTHQKKLAALDLAARNAAIQAELEKDKGKDHPQGDATAPATAKRLGPGPTSAPAPKPFSSGWLNVRPTFESSKDAASTSSAATSPAAIPASLVEAESDTSRVQTEDEGPPADNSDAASIKSNATNTGSGYMSQMYRGILDYRINRAATGNARSTPAPAGSGTTPAGTAARENFYCILKSPILYLYSSDDTSNPNTECHAAIDLRGKRVSIFVAGLGDTLGELDPEQPLTNQGEQLGDAAAETDSFDAKYVWSKAKRALVRDGELFMKRNAIRIVGPAPERKSSRVSHLGRKRPQWFIFCKNNYFMEDWYHALLQASLMPDSSLSAKLSDDGHDDPASHLFGKLDDPIGPTFSKEDMASLLVSLDSLPDPLPLRWLNAMVGRIFYSIYRTAWLEDYIVSKMMRKINRVKTPGFLGDIKVEEVDVGRRAPGFSRPMLKALTAEGEASMEIAVHYVGEVRITISTTLTLSLGSRFKPYNIPIVLAVVLTHLEGNLLLHVKRPPSNRLWFGFTAMPKMDLEVEPVVSARKVQWSMVTRLIEGRIKELLQESIVVPNMDDISFFDTRSLPLRGGIFADAAKKADGLCAQATSSTTSALTDPASSSADVKRTASSLNTSDLLSANKVGTASAPVSGAATPVTSEAAGGSNPRDIPTGEEGEASSINAGSTQSNAALRNRKGGNDSAVVRKDSAVPAAHKISPAAAGLSDLLSRDLAASGGALLSGSPPRQDSQSGKRRTWFGAGPKSSTLSASSSTGLSTLGLGAAAALGGRSGREHSSLALGNASIERPSQRSNSASVPGKSDAVLSLPTEASTRAVSDSVNNSAASTLSELGKTAASRDRSSTTLSAEAAASHREASREQGRSSEAPSLIVSSASEPQLALRSADNSADLTRDHRTTLEAPARHEAVDEQNLIDSPSSLTHSGRSSVRSSKSDLVKHLPQKDSAAASDDVGGIISSRKTSRDAEGSDSQAASASQKRMPPPPPPRRPAGSQSNDRPASRQDAATALTNVQRSRYGLGEGDRGTAENANALASSTSAMLLSSWNKAKASMADKESRQAAAKDAKDAIKRGWANWNAKRVEGKRMPTEDEGADRYDQHGMSRSNSSRLSLVPGKSAWLASSPPDPTSYGLGFDKSNPEDTRGGFRDKHGSAAYYTGLRSNHTDTDDDNASVHSNSSNRQPYRELRAAKKVHGFGSEASDSRPSSVSSTKFASNASLSTPQSTDASLWDAEIPTLTPPARAYREEEADSKRKALDRTISNETPVKATSSAFAERKPSSSISSTGQSGGGISFIPPAPAATTELVSPSSLGSGGMEATQKKESVSDKKPLEVKTEVPAAASTAALEPRTPERRNADERTESTVSEAHELSSENEAQAAQPSTVTKEPESSPRILDAQPLSREPSVTSGRKADFTAVNADAQRVTRDLSADKTPSASSHEPTPAERAATDRSPARPDKSYTPEYPEVESPNLGSGIKKQPGRATMMAVPGIPSMQKSGPQSFSAPPPPEAAQVEVDTSPSAFRASSLFKIPAFGSPISGGSSGVRRGSGKAAEDATKVPPLVAPPPVPARPTAEMEGTALGLTKMIKAQTVVEDDKPTGKEDGEAGTFADVAKAQGPAADPGFEQAQIETGDTVHIGNKEVKLPTAADIEARQ